MKLLMAVTVALLMTLAPLHACTDADDPEVGELQHNEIIEIHGGCPPGTIGNGEVCVDPLEGGNGPGGGGGPTGGEGGPGGPGGPGPGGGGGGADPHPIPAPKDCTVETDHEACMQCCDWNVDKVWGERCRRIPKKNKEDRKQCWIEAEKRRSECQRPCPRPDPIVTIRGPQ